MNFFFKYGWWLLAVLMVIAVTILCCMVETETWQPPIKVTNTKNQYIQIKVDTTKYYFVRDGSTIQIIKK